MAWTNLTFSFGAILTSSQMTQLDDNFDALAAGGIGAPDIVEAALAAVVAAKLVTNGNSHDHSGGDGGAIPNASVTGLGSCALISSVTAAYLATDAVIQAKIKTASGSQSGSILTGTYITISLNAYSFFPDVEVENTIAVGYMGADINATPAASADAPQFRIHNSSVSDPYLYSVAWRYVASV